MINFQEFLDDFTTELKSYAKENWAEYSQAVINDGKDFIMGINKDLEKWIMQVNEGKLTQEEFEWLMKSKKDAAELIALKEVGLTKVKLDSVKLGLVNMVIKASSRLLG